MNVEFQSVSFRYESGLTPGIQALNEISLTLTSDELCAIAGSAGSGKTTLIQHLNGLLTPTAGHVLIDGSDIRNRGVDRTLRSRIGLVFQFPENQFFEETVREDIAFGPKNLGLSSDTVEARIQSAMAQVELESNLGERSPFQLSGGEKRRAAIAGILAMEPEILVLDEPTVGLDGRGAKQVEEVIRGYHSRGRGVIFISHDMDLIARLAQRVIALSKGSVAFDGHPADLFKNQPLLETCGLEKPRIVQFMEALNAEGLCVNSECYTVESAKAEIRRVMQNPDN